MGNKRARNPDHNRIRQKILLAVVVLRKIRRSGTYPVNTVYSDPQATAP